MSSDFRGQRIRDLVNRNKIAAQYEYNYVGQNSIY
jgi:hypothetical protein